MTEVRSQIEVVKIRWRVPAGDDEEAAPASSDPPFISCNRPHQTRHERFLPPLFRNSGTPYSASPYEGFATSGMWGILRHRLLEFEISCIQSYHNASPRIRFSSAWRSRSRSIDAGECSAVGSLGENSNSPVVGIIVCRPIIK